MRILMGIILAVGLCVAAVFLWDPNHHYFQLDSETALDRADSTGDDMTADSKSTPTGEDAPVQKTEAQWREQLTAEQYEVCWNKGTERAFTGKYWDSKAKGVYKCVCCGNELFDSETKYESGTGWPSFYQPHDETSVSTVVDKGWFRSRTEVLCRRCGSHLGHVFNDGPAPTGMRYCLNSAALELEEKSEGK